MAEERAPQAQLIDFRGHRTQTLRSGGDSPTSGDMEARVNRLEDQMTECLTILRALQPLIIRLDEWKKSVPTKGFVFTITIALIGLVVATIALAPYLRVPG